MDTSEKYIKMCEKAKEIQKRWSPKVCDYVWRGEKYLQIKDACVVITDINFQKTEEIWLPRQDQLQELAGIKSIPRLLSMFNTFVVVGNIYYTKLFKDSFEKLWLAFVMKGKYNKIWDGDEWTEK